MTDREADDPYNKDPDKWTHRYERNKQYQDDEDRAEKKARESAANRDSKPLSNVPLPKGCGCVIGVVVMLAAVVLIYMLMNGEKKKIVIVSKNIAPNAHHSEKLRLRPPMATRLEIKSDQPVDVLVLTDAGHAAFTQGGLASVKPGDVFFRTSQSQTKLTEILVTKESQGLQGWVVVLNPGKTPASVQMAAKAVPND